MPHLILLLFKINLVLLLFSATYYLILRKLTFYTANRIFLVFGIIFSSTYPFIDLTALVEHSHIAPAILPSINQNLNLFAENSLGSLFWTVLTFAFYAGGLFMAARLLLQFISLRRIHNNSSPAIFDDLKVRILEEKVSPFSFWQTIYVNPGLHQKNDLNNILEHERIHVKEWHTLDIILSEFCLVIYWFNPGVWLMKKAIRENIEFITDAKILRKGIDKKAYQYSLLKVGTLQPSLSLVNNFNLSDLKKRIRMMNRKQSRSMLLTRYLFAIPILLFTLAFTVNKKAVKETLVPLEKVVVEFLPKQEQHVEHKLVKAIKVKIQKKNKSSESASRGSKVMVFERSSNSKDSISIASQAPSVENIISENNSGKITALKIIKASELNKSTVMGSLIIRDTTNRDDFVKDAGDIVGKNSIIFYKKLDIKASPKYRLNGKEISSEELKNLQTSRIESMVVNKENGTIEFKTKD